LIKYVIKRILVAIPLVLAIVCMNFVIIHSAPGDPVAFMVSGVENATPQFMALKRAELGLDKPLYVQLFIYLSTILRGDLGYSFIYHRPVADVIAERLQATLLLTFTSFIITLVVGILAGVAASKRPYSRTDALFTIGALGIYSMPDFWVGLIAIIIFSVNLKLTPIFGMVDPGLTGWNYWANLLWHLALPATTLGLGRLALYSRLSRASMLEVMRQDYITTAWAKGCDERTVFYKHGLRNALLPLVTVLGFQTSFLFAGAVLTETVFAWPGIGRLLYQSIFFRDYLMIQSLFLVFSILTIAGNLLADIAYAYLDPRIRYK
jgi:peptide/nickel transport system permease protein